MTEQETVTLGSVKRSQVIWCEWMEKATEGMSDSEMVEVVRRREPFGTYLVSIAPAKETLTDEMIKEAIEKSIWPQASSIKRGRNPRWPFVPVLRYCSPELPKGGFTAQIKGLAFATREEAVACAADHIAGQKALLERKLRNPRYRALRQSLGLPSEIVKVL